MGHLLQHHSVRTSVAVGGILAALSVAADLPWPIWAVWAGLTALAVRQAVRS